jgi:hypothetical protein
MAMVTRRGMALPDGRPKDVDREFVSMYIADNAHTPHWHGNTVLVAGQRTDVVAVTSAQMITADMVPDAPGIGLYHCHISDHMLAGMVARYQVEPRQESSESKRTAPSARGLGERRGALSEVR